MNDVLLVHTTTFRVTKPEILGTAPTPRADMEVIFDPKHGQLIVFSGYGRCERLQERFIWKLWGRYISFRNVFSSCRQEISDSNNRE